MSYILLAVFGFFSFMFVVSCMWYLFSGDQAAYILYLFSLVGTMLCVIGSM